MTTKQESKLKMLLTLRMLLQVNADIVSTLPNSGEFISVLDDAIARIQNNSEFQHHNATGVAENKKQMRDHLIELTMDYSLKFQAYVKYIKDTDLLASTKFTKSMLRMASDLELIDIVNNLHDVIQKYLKDLTIYALTEESQTTFQNAITAFTESIPVTRQVQVDKRESTKQMNIGFDDADMAVENLDALVEIVRLTQATFYSEYKATRKVIDKSGSLQVMGTVTDAATNEPVVDATLQFILNGDIKPTIEKQTAAKGGYKIKNLAEGIYSINVSKVGYQTKTVTAVISSDQLCELNVELMKN